MPDFHKAPERGVHSIPLGPLLHIERSDFSEEDQKGFRRLTPRQPVGLKYTSSTISVLHVVKVHCMYIVCYITNADIILCQLSGAHEHIHTYTVGQYVSDCVGISGV